MKIIRFEACLLHLPTVIVCLGWFYVLLEVWRSSWRKSEFRIFNDVCLTKAASQQWEGNLWGGTKGGRILSYWEALNDWRRRKSYVHGNVPGHVDVGFVFIHPDFSGSQCIAFGVIVNIIVVGLLGALNVGHSGTWQDLHAPSTLPHLDNRKKRWGFVQDFVITGKP